jgi:hypothetical protein
LDPLNGRIYVRKFVVNCAEMRHQANLHQLKIKTTVNIVLLGSLSFQINFKTSKIAQTGAHRRSEFYPDLFAWRFPQPAQPGSRV